MGIQWQCSSDSIAAEACRVLAFNAEESISIGYTFDILLAINNIPLSDVPDFLKKVVRDPLVTLKGSCRAGEFVRHGVVTSITHAFNDKDTGIFRILLSPRAPTTLLSLRTRIFLGMTLPEILTKLFKDEGLSSVVDFEDKLQSTYKPYGFTCQYDERAIMFARRHMSRLGVYFYIQQTDSGDIMVLADGDTTVEKLPLRHDLVLQEGQEDLVLISFCRTYNRTAHTVIFRDYHTEHMQVGSVQAEDTEDLFGGGVLNFFGRSNMYTEVDIATRDEIKTEDLQYIQRLPQVVVRIMKTKAHCVKAESTLPWLQAGYAITVEDKDYQLVSVTHMCNAAKDEIEERYVRRARHAGFMASIANGYRNTFTCHPLDVCAYATEVTLAPPSVGGCVQAVIDGAGDGKYAEIDSQGRYRVRFFCAEDNKVFQKTGSTAGAGNFSIPLRMMQSHVGEKSGIHFPLLKNVEVIVAFLNGDPDRPFILGAMSNPQNPSVISDKNHQSNILQSPGGHSLNLSDTEEAKKLSLQSSGGHTLVMSDEAGKEEFGMTTSDPSCFFRFVRK